MREPTGRSGCPACMGQGSVAAHPGYLTGERKPCPLCIEKDQLLWGVAYSYRGQRVDPTEAAMWTPDQVEKP